jgi:uncharacterized phiE125 gp8 family phage protein
MPRSVEIYEAATAEPLSLAEMKAHLRVDTDDEDAMIADCIATARAYTENVSGVRFVNQTADVFLDAWPEQGSPILLPLRPVTAIQQVHYFPEAANLADESAYTHEGPWFLDGAFAPARLALPSGAAWPSEKLRPVRGIRVRVNVGWASAAAVPPELRRAVRMLAAHYFTHRESVVIGDRANIDALSVPFGFESLIARWRVWM